MCLVDISASPYGPLLLPRVSALTLPPPWPLFLVHLSPFAFEAGATTGNNGCSHSSSHRQPCPGLADSATLHGSAAKPKLTGEEEVEEEEDVEEEEERETVTREEGIWSHQGESQYAQSVGV